MMAASMSSGEIRAAAVRFNTKYNAISQYGMPVRCGPPHASPLPPRRPGFPCPAGAGGRAPSTPQAIDHRPGGWS